MTPLDTLHAADVEKRIDVLRAFKMNIIAFYTWNFSPDPRAQSSINNTLAASAVKKSVYLALEYMRDAGYTGDFTFSPNPKVCTKMDFAKLLPQIDSSVERYRTVLEELQTAQGEEPVQAGEAPQVPEAVEAEEQRGARVEERNQAEGQQDDREEAQARFFESAERFLEQQITMQNAPFFKRNMDKLCLGRDSSYPECDYQLLHS